MVEAAASERPSVQRTGTPWRSASAVHMISSAYTFSLEPNPPPTDGATTRTFCSGNPRVRATMTLRMWGI